MAELGCIDMLTNNFLVPARDPGSLSGYTGSLSVRMCSIDFGGRGSILEAVSGYAVYVNIPQSSIGEYLVW